MVEAPRVELPNREEYKRAISQWWKGGGTTEKIVDSLRKAGATLGEAEQVAERMAARAERGNSFVDYAVLEEQIEAIRAASAWSRGRVAQPLFESWKCIFSKAPCPQCSELEGAPVIHGELPLGVRS